MFIIKVLFWLALIGSVIGGAVVASRVLRNLHTLFRPIWFLVPVCLALPLFTLLDRPQFGSPLWRALLALCAALCLWAVCVGLIEAGRKTLLWLKHPNLRAGSASGQPLDDRVQGAEDESTLRWEDALQLVLMLDAYRWDAGLPSEWLDGQCASFPLLAEALSDLRGRGLLKSGARPATAGFTPGGGIPPQGDPYEVLGIPRGARQEEIRRAYREQMKRYHPDRLQQFGPEFTRLAEEKAKLIQWAYVQLTSSVAEPNAPGGQ